MNVLIFDTETTGLPKSRNTSKGKWYKDWPHIVQISWILYDALNDKFLDIHDHIIKMPDGVVIPDDSVKIHGITNEMSQLGDDIIDVLDMFRVAYSQSNTIVGHNIEFDINAIKATLLNNNCVNFFELEKQTPIYCTMKNSIDLCKIKAISKYTGKEYFKWPRLIELHKYLFHNQEPNNLHNSLTDIYVTLRCYYKMMYDRDILQLSKKFKSNTKNIFA